MKTPARRLLVLTALCAFGGAPLYAANRPAQPPVPPSPPEAAVVSVPPAPAKPAAPPIANSPGPAHAAAELPARTRPAPVSKVAAGGVLGRDVLGPDGQPIGRVVDVLVDAGSNPRAAVIDFGGFMGVGSRRIAVNWSDLSFPPVSPAGDPGDIRLDLTSEQIMNAPVYTDQTKPAAVVEPPPAASSLVKPGH